MASTPDTPAPRNVINPFKDIAQPTVDKRHDELITQRDELDTANNGLVSDISDELSKRLEAAYADDDQSLEAQIAKAEPLNQELKRIFAILSGDTVAAASSLTPLQQQAIDDVASRRLFQHRSGAWGDREWATRNPAPAAPADTPAPNTTTPAASAPAPAGDPEPVDQVLGRLEGVYTRAGGTGSAPAPAAPADTPAPNTTTPAASAPAPAAPAATPAPATTAPAAPSTTAKLVKKGRGWGIGPSRGAHS